MFVSTFSTIGTASPRSTRLDTSNGWANSVDSRRKRRCPAATCAFEPSPIRRCGAPPSIDDRNVPAGAAPLYAAYRKWRPSGRNQGNSCDVWPSASVVTGSASRSPRADTRASVAPFVNRISSAALQVPGIPDERGTLAMVRGDPPPTLILRSSSPTKNPMKRLSGDQNGPTAPSVPGNGVASPPDSGRSHNRILDSVLTPAAYTR